MSKARDIADLDFNSPDIDGGNIDGATIGATTAAAGSFSNVNVGGQNILNDNYDAVGAIFRRSGSHGAVISLGRQGVGDGVTLDYPSDNTFAVSTAGVERFQISSGGAATFSSSVTATSLDISGDIDIDGTANLDTVDIDGPVNAAAAVTINGVLTANSGVVFNENSVDVDFRVETNASSNGFLVDSGNERVLTQTSGGFEAEFGGAFNYTGLTIRNTGSSISSSHKALIDFEVNGSGGVVNRAQIIGGKTSSGSTTGYLRFNVLDDGAMETRLTLQPDAIVVNENSSNVDFRVESNNNANMLFVDGGNDRVGIGRVPTTHAFEVEGHADFKSNMSVAGNISVASGNGILLGGTGTANKLDDYEEGTWIPDLRGGSSAGTTTYGARVGWYTRVGDLVTVNALIYNTNFTGSGLAEIHGLPFTAVGESTGDAQINGHDSSLPSTICNLTSIIQDNAIIHMRGTYHDTTVGPYYVQIQRFTYLRVSMTYKTS